MSLVQYPTPEWLEESAKKYRANPKFQKELHKITANMYYRIKAEPAWGIDEDILFGINVEDGELLEISFVSEAEAKEKADYLMAATPQEWKSLLRKNTKFLTDFMTGKITLELGSKVGVLGLAPHANTLIDALTPGEIQFPDEMTTEELEQLRADVAGFRAELGV